MHRKMELFYFYDQLSDNLQTTDSVEYFRWGTPNIKPANIIQNTPSQNHIHTWTIKVHHIVKEQLGTTLFLTNINGFCSACKFCNDALKFPR